MRSIESLKHNINKDIEQQQHPIGQQQAFVSFAEEHSSLWRAGQVGETQIQAGVADLAAASSGPWRLPDGSGIPRRQNLGFWFYLQHSGRQ